MIGFARGFIPDAQRSAGLLDHDKVAHRRALRVLQRRLVFGRVVAGDSGFQAGEAGDDVAGAVAAFQLDIAAAAGEEDPAMRAMASVAPLA
jgi:hypothetical protein